MGKKKIKTVLIISSMLILTFNNFDMSIAVNQNIEMSSINNFNLNLDLSFTADIFGYELDVLDVKPIERDEEAILNITHITENSAEIIINTKFGKFIYTDLHIEEETMDSNTKRTMCRYEIENPKKGLFMEIHIMTDLTRINLAFDGGNSQLNYDGVISKGLKDYKTLSGDSVISDDLDLSNRKIDIQEYKKDLITQQNNNLQINNREQSTPQEQSKDGKSTILKYGVVHETYDFDFDYPDVLWDDYWEPYTSLDYGVYRYLPTESQVKSDLQFYNTVHTDPYQTSRRIIPYTLVNHGGPEWGIYEFQWVWIIWPIWRVWQQVHIGTIYPSEISNLWYSYMGAYVYPAESLVFADVCFGYWYTENEPDMAEAFIDDGGADAFVGSTISFIAEESFKEIFWDSLSSENEDVETATEDFCDDHGGGWNLGDEWRIMGDTSKTLPD